MAGSLRQTEQHLKHQSKLHDDEAARWKQKEQMLTRRLETLQRDWRKSSTRLETTQRDLTHQRKQVQADQARTYKARTTVERHTLITDQNAETEARLKPTEPAVSRPRAIEPDAVVSRPRPLDPEPIAEPLVELETQAQKELAEWQHRRDKEDEDDRQPPPPAAPTAPGNGPRQPDDDQPRKTLFRPRPWMRLK